MKSGFPDHQRLISRLLRLRPETVTIPVPGATKPIQGDLYGSGTSGVILTHGGGRTKESWRKQAHALADAEFVVLAINFRSDTIDVRVDPSQ